MERQSITSTSGSQEHYNPIAKNAVLIAALGPIVIFMIIEIVLGSTYPTPPPDIFYSQLTLAAGILLVISLPIIWVLKRRERREGV